MTSNKQILVVYLILVAIGVLVLLTGGPRFPSYF